jgi:lipopolysaccharide transport system ATP-binding protein
MRDTIIKFDHVSKEYRLGTIGYGTLKGAMQSWWADLRNREDPNSVIGTKPRSRREKLKALDDITFQVERGELLGIIGHNGAGKSTLLKLLSRVTAPTSGRISYNGRVASILEVGTGFHYELTGRENIYLNGAILGMTRPEIRRKFDDIVDFAELAQFIDTPIKRYSSGMYLRLAFAVAAHLDNEIMVMDEVLAVGDMKFQSKCLEKMDDISKQDARTILYVSHNLNTIRSLCRRSIVLSHGQIVFDGPTDEAIPYYLDTMDKNHSCDIDLSDKKMAKFICETRAKMTRLVIKGKEQPVYLSGEPMNFLLEIRANGNIEKLFARFEFRYADGSQIGTSMTPLGGMRSGEKKRFSLHFAAPAFAPGKYSVLICIYEVNEFGIYHDFDAVDPAFWFEIRDDMGISWNPNGWGYVKFNDMQEKPSGSDET